MMNKPAILLLAIAAAAVCQQLPDAPVSALPVQPAQNGSSRDALANSTGTLAVNDRVLIDAADVDGLGNNPLQIESDGTITLPLVGKIPVAGLTPGQLERELTEQFAIYIRSPRVTVKRAAEKGGTIVLAGAFKNPGVYTLSGRRTLLDILSATGGLQQGTGRTLRITRRLDANNGRLPSGVEDPDAGVSTATVSLTRLIEDRDASQNILVEPDDVLLAEPPGIVFVSGEVLRPGPVQLAERDSYGLTELIALAGGFSREADANNTRILRPILGGSRRAEIPIDTKSILEGHIADFRVLANDIVVVPHAKGKGRVLRKAALYLVPAAISALVYVAAAR